MTSLYLREKSLLMAPFAGLRRYSFYYFPSRNSVLLGLEGNYIRI